MRAVAFGEEKEPACRLEIERTAERAKRADHHCAPCGKPLLGGPQRFLALARAHDNEAAWIEPEVQEARRIGRALLGEDTFLPRPDQPGRAGPAGRQT